MKGFRPHTKTPIERTPASARVYHELRRRILHGELAAGSPLSETEIAGELEVSRTPVREALRELLSDALVLDGRRRQCVVADTSPELEREVLLMRTALEESRRERSGDRRRRIGQRRAAPHHGPHATGSRGQRCQRCARLRRRVPPASGRDVGAANCRRHRPATTRLRTSDRPEEGVASGRPAPFRGRARTDHRRPRKRRT